MIILFIHWEVHNDTVCILSLKICISEEDFRMIFTHAGPMTHKARFQWFIFKKYNTPLNDQHIPTFMLFFICCSCVLLDSTALHRKKHATSDDCSTELWNFFTALILLYSPGEDGCTHNVKLHSLLLHTCYGVERFPETNSVVVFISHSNQILSLQGASPLSKPLGD